MSATFESVRVANSTKAVVRVANTFLTELSQATLVIDDDVKTMLVVF